MSMRRPVPILPDRRRTIERPFGWIPLRLLTSGLLGRMSPNAQRLYFFLCLVADREGLSFYSEFRISSTLKLIGPQFTQARNELEARDLIAYDGKVYQVLSLPALAEQSKGSQGASSAAAILERLGFGG